MAGKAGWWNRNEQVSGQQGWTPVHKLGDYSVGRGGGGGGALSYGLGALAGAAIAKKLGGKGAPAKPAQQAAIGTGGGTPVGSTAMVTPGFEEASMPRNQAFNAGATSHLTNVRSVSNTGTDVDTWAGGRYQGFDPGLNGAVTPTPARLQPFRAGIGEAEPETAELVSMPNSGGSGPPSPGQNVWSHGTWNTPERSDELSQNAWARSRELQQEPSAEPLMLNPGPQQPAVKAKRKPGIQPMGKARIDRDLAQYRA